MNHLMAEKNNEKNKDSQVGQVTTKFFKTSKFVEVSKKKGIQLISHKKHINFKFGFFPGENYYLFPQLLRSG